MAEIADLRGKVTIDTGSVDQAKQKVTAAFGELAAATRGLSSVTQEATERNRQWQKELDGEAAATQRSSAFKRQAAAFEKELTAAKLQLRAALEGEGNAAAQTAARYSLLATRHHEELAAVRQEIAAQGELAAAQQRGQAERVAAAEAAQTKIIAVQLAAAREEMGIQAELAAAHQKAQADMLAAQATAARRIQQFDEAAAARLARDRQNVGRNLQTAGQGLTGAVTTPILAVGGAAIASELQVQGGEVAVAQRTGATGQQLANLDALMKRVAVTVPQSFREVGQAVGDLFARTHETGTALEGLARSELDLARISGGSVNETVKTTTQLFAAWQVSTAAQIPTLDLLAKAHQATGIAVTDLAGTLSKGAPVFRAYGLGLTESAALLASFEKAHIPADRALQGLTQGVARLSKAGITDLHGALAQLIHDLEGAKRPTDAYAEAVRILGARTGVQFADAVRSGRLNLAQLTQALEKSSGTIERTAKASDTFGVEFAKALHQAEVALAPLGVTLLQIGTQILQALTPAIDLVARLTDAFSHLPQGLQTTIVTLALTAAAFGPLVGGIGKSIVAASEFREAWLGLRAAILGAEGAPAIGAAIAGIGASAVAASALWVAAFAAVTFSIVKLLEKLEESHPALRRFALATGRAFGAGGSAVDPNAPSGGGGTVYGPGEGPRYSGPEEAAAAARRQVLSGAGLSGANLAAYQHIGEGQGKGKESPLSREQKRYTDELADSQSKLNELMAGGDKVAAGVAARYHLLSAAARERLVTVLSEIEHQTELNQINETIDKNSRVRALLARGESVEVARLGGEHMKLSVGELQSAIASQRQTEAAVKAAESHKEYTRDLAKTNAEIRRLRAGYDAEAGGLDELVQKYPGLTAAQLQHLFAVDQEEKHLLKLHAAQQKVNEAIRDGAKRFAESKIQTDAGRVAIDLYADAWTDFLKRNPGGDAEGFWNTLTPAQQRRAKGTATENTTTGLNNQLRDLQRENRALSYYNPVQQMAIRGYNTPLQGLPQSAVNALNDVYAAQATNEQRQAHDQAYQAPTHRANQLIGTVGPQLADLRDQFAALTGKSTAARLAMQQFGVRLQELPRSAQQSVRALLDLQHGMQFIQDLGQGVESVFTNVFSNLTHGFKGFFANVITGFEQMLQQIAVKYLASQAANLFMNLLGPALGGLFGGSGAAHRASGGPIDAGMPYLVGENGPEMILPARPGYVVPHSQVQGTGGGAVTVNFHVHGVQDVNSFRQNRGSIMGDLGRAIDRARRTGS